MKLDEVSASLMESMTFHVNIAERIDLHRIIEFLSNLFLAEPLLTPERFSARDPAKNKYTTKAFAKLINDCEFRGSLMIMGKNRCYSLYRSVTDKGETWYFNFDLRAISITTIQSVAKQIFTFPVSIGTLHAISQSERNYCESLGLGDTRRDGYRFRSFHHELILGLPTLAWKTFFGPRYIKHFGRERLLSAPAWSVQEIRSDVIAVQLTEKIQSIDIDWDHFHSVRQKIIAYLGPESFARARTPNDPPALEDYIKSVPATSIPDDLILLRQKHDEDVAREWRHRQPEEQIATVEEILADPLRFRVGIILVNKGQTERVIIDDCRKEYIRFPNATMRNACADALIAKGAEFRDYAKMTVWGKRDRPIIVDGPVPPGVGEKHNTKLLYLDSKSLD